MNNHGTKLKHQGVQNKLIKYLNSIDKSDLRFSELTPTFIRNLQGYFRTAADPAQLKPNQVTHYLKIIKSIVNLKIQEEPYLYTIHPFISIKMDFNADVIKRTILLDDDIYLLINGKLENKQVDLHRDMLLFEIFAAGMRVSDLMLLRWNNIKSNHKSKEAKIEYKMFKTGKTMSIPLTVQLCFILHKIMEYKLFGEDLIAKDGGQIDTLYNTGFQPLFKDYFNTNNGNDRHFTAFEMEAELRKQCIEITKANPNTEQFFGSVYNEKEGIVYYKGYAFKKEKETIIKEVINYIDKIKVDLERWFILNSSHTIRDFIEENQCHNNFVFPHLNNELFENIGDDNDFDRITEFQYKKLNSAEVAFNTQLKSVGKRLGIKHNLSSHVGRHTFTQLMLNDDIQTHLITQALGHKNIAATIAYTKDKFNADKNDAVINQIANNINNRKD